MSEVWTCISWNERRCAHHMVQVSLCFFVLFFVLFLFCFLFCFCFCCTFLLCAVTWLCLKLPIWYCYSNRHRVCMGFYVTEKAEGRNDVFSAVYTRWKEAPKLIIYDFSCQLEKYCMVHFAASCFVFCWLFFFSLIMEHMYAIFELYTGSRFGVFRRHQIRHRPTSPKEPRWLLWNLP